MFQGKGKARQRFAATGRDGQRKHPRRFLCLVPTLPEHLGTHTIDLGRRNVCKLLFHVGIKAGQ